MANQDNDILIDELVSKADDRLKDHSTLVGFIVTNIAAQEQDALVYLIRMMMKADYISFDEFVHQFIVP